MTEINDGNGAPHAIAGGFMARLRQAEHNARAKPDPLLEVLAQQATLHEDMRELKQRLRSLEEGIERLAREQKRRNSSDND